MCDILTRNITFILPFFMEITTLLEKTFRLNSYQKRALVKLGLLNAGDLLRHFPARYGDVAVMKNIGDLVAGETAVIFGQISNLKTSKAFYKKIPMGEAKISDESGDIKVVWFNQPYIARMFSEGSLVRVEGKISKKRAKARGLRELAQRDGAEQRNLSVGKFRVS